MRTLVVCVLLALATTPLAAQTFVFDLRGAQEVPPVPSTASGGCMGVLNQGARTFALTCVHNVVGPTVMHIHNAPAGSNGAIVFDMGDPTSPVTATWTSMTDAQIAAVLAGNMYINIHTAGRPAGEIRGQILPRTVDTVNFTADGSQVVPPGATAATATCTANLNDPATALAVSCTHTVPDPTAAHIHQAPFGFNGLEIFTFPSPASPLAADVPLTAEQVAAFAATFLYLDIHADDGVEETPDVNIRGQIGTPPAGAGTGTIRITKTTFPAGGSGFSFSETVTPGNFALNDGGTRTFNSVAPGAYTITEADPATTPGGSTLGAIRCDDANSTTNTAARTATVQLEAGEVVTCTFENLETAATDSIFVFHLSGDQETPPVVTPRRGGCMGRFDAGASQLTLVCTHDVDDATVMHVHRGAPGVAGTIAFDMGDPTSPVIATWSGMTPADVADLFAGNLYVNIHTDGRPAGEIRGQILARTVDTVNFTMNGAQVVPPNAATSTGNCTANLDDPAQFLAVQCTHNHPTPDEAHVHQGDFGENGPLVFTFPSAASPFSGNVPMTPRLVADFAGRFLYVELHGTGDSEVEATETIRGQIGAAPAVPTTGTIVIRKATTPGGGTGFNFTDDVPGSGGAFTLNDGQAHTFLNVTPGTYTIAEAVPAGYSVTDITCGDGDSAGNVATRSATIRLQAGETVDCTFHNLQSLAGAQLFVFQLSGAQEVPPVSTTARGGCFGQLNAGAGTFSLVCTHNVSDPAVMHIHRGAPGVNGPIVFDLGSPVSPVEALWTGMTPQDVADLLAGNLYVNVHSGGRPSGEIRGQILPRTVDNFAFFATGAQEVPPSGSDAIGRCTADLSDNATFVAVQCSHNVDNVTISHLHVAPPGVDGPVVFNFPNTNPFSGDVPLSPRLVADFAAGFLYVNIHSVDSEQGEIRGQLIADTAAAQSADIPTASEWALLLLALGVGVVGFLGVRRP